MNVLSLFDGMSCGRIALERAGIPVKGYYASEIDKYAQIVSEKNYPDIIRLGDVTKWREWKIPRPDMIIGGSPCQGFSFAGKGLNFDDPRSKLFFTFADIVKHYKPRYFLLENVKMKKEHQKVISDVLGVEPIEINSALVSAQNRKRLYWTNIPGITQPEDRGIFLRDIINPDAERKTRDISAFNPVFGSTYLQYDVHNKGHRSISQRAYYIDGKAGTLNKSTSSLVRFVSTETHIKWLTIEEEEALQTVPEGYTRGVPDTQRHAMLGNGWTVDVIAHIFRGLKNA